MRCGGTGGASDDGGAFGVLERAKVMVLPVLAEEAAAAAEPEPECPCAAAKLDSSVMVH